MTTCIRMPHLTTFRPKPHSHALISQKQQTLILYSLQIVLVVIVSTMYSPKQSGGL